MGTGRLEGVLQRVVRISWLPVASLSLFFSQVGITNVSHRMNESFSHVCYSSCMICCYVVRTSDASAGCAKSILSSYKTSFLRSPSFEKIAQRHIPVPKTNLSCRLLDSISINQSTYYIYYRESSLHVCKERG